MGYEPWQLPPARPWSQSASRWGSNELLSGAPCLRPSRRHPRVCGRSGALVDPIRVKRDRGSAQPLSIQKPGTTAASTTINKHVIVTASPPSMMILPIRTNSTTRTENLAEVLTVRKMREPRPMVGLCSPSEKKAHRRSDEKVQSSQANSGCMLSGAKRVHPVIVSWSTANRPLMPKPINDNPAAHRLRQLQGETGS